MPDEIIFDDTLQIVRIRSFDFVTADDIKNSIQQILNLLRDSDDCKKILVDTREQTSMPGTFDIYKIFSELPREFKVAVLTQTGQTTNQEIYFAETVATNRGFLLKEFRDEAAALEWLK